MQKPFVALWRAPVSSTVIQGALESPARSTSRASSRKPSWPAISRRTSALWGSVKAHGFLPDTVIVSDDAGQFNVGQHGLCWVHCERLVHKLDAFTADNRAAQTTVRALIWQFYADLKAYRRNPVKRRKTVLRARFDRIFQRKTGFVTLDRLLGRLNANKPELLMVLDRPEIPLHTHCCPNIN